jgi:hypothetical protein
MIVLDSAEFGGFFYHKIGKAFGYIAHLELIKSIKKGEKNEQRYKKPRNDSTSWR